MLLTYLVDPSLGLASNLASQNRPDETLLASRVWKDTGRWLYIPGRFRLPSRATRHVDAQFLRHCKVGSIDARVIGSRGALHSL